MATSSDSTPMASSPIPNLQPDPLLEPGSFIDADPVAPAAAAAAAGKEEVAAAATPKSGGKKGAAAAAAGEEGVVGTPSWLPDGWKMIYKTRTSGATAGTVDRYYFDPSSEHRFRSKKEVDYFIKFGTKRKKSDGTPDVQPSESPAAGKKKSGSKSRRPTLPPNFDFDDVPEMTTWKLTDPENDVWTPYIDDKPVKKAVRQEWEAVFQFLSSGNDRPM